MKHHKIITTAILLALPALFGGCATIVASQLRGKLPKVEADSLAVTVNVAGVGGGTASTKDQKYDASGNLILGELHEAINTPTGSLKIDGVNVKLPAK